MPDTTEALTVRQVLRAVRSVPRIFLSRGPKRRADSSQARRKNYGAPSRRRGLGRKLAAAQTTAVNINRPPTWGATQASGRITKG
jgi:hypothetical protein